MANKYTTPDLPYTYDALEPYIDQETMTIHHNKHHVTYTTKLNVAIEKHPDIYRENPADLLKDLASIPEDIRTAVRNNGGGHVNHILFWEIMGPSSKGAPEGDLLSAIDNDLGGYEEFVKNFEEAATTQFGSGWAWLAVDNGKLVVEKTTNQDTPLSEGRTPILALDVWEHAYYLKYKNVRPDYVKAFWNVVNWEMVEKKFSASK